MTQDEFSDDLIRHCEQEALGAVAADTADLVRAVLSASGYAELVASRDEWTNIAVQRGLELEDSHGRNAELVAALKEALEWRSRDMPISVAMRFAALAAAGVKPGAEAECKELRTQNAKLVAERDIAWASNAGLTTDVLALRAQNAELVAALEFYARGTANTAHKSDPEDWEVKDYSDGSTRSIAIKFGERARSALAAAGHKQGSGE
jgi:hypothetical protein